MIASLLVLADVTGTGHPSNVSAGAVLTLVVPLALLLLVFGAWALAARHGWAPLPTTRHPAPQRRRHWRARRNGGA